MSFVSIAVLYLNYFVRVGVLVFVDEYVFFEETLLVLCLHSLKYFFYFFCQLILDVQNHHILPIIGSCGASIYAVVVVAVVVVLVVVVPVVVVPVVPVVVIF